MTKYSLLIFCMLGLTVGCVTEKTSAAKLNFARFQAVNGNYEVVFHADQHIESFISKQKGKNIVSKKLLCSLEGENDFRVVNKMGKTFEGNFVLTAKEGDNKYRYSATGDFIHFSDSHSQMRILEQNEVIEMLTKKAYIDCKALITVYFAAPYSSDLMRVPAVDILRVLKPQ